MKYKKIDQKIFFRVEKGEELVEQIKILCQNEKIGLGNISGIGATDKVVLGLFVTKTKEYVSKEYNGDHEITSCLGNVTKKDGDVYLHLHANIVGIDGNVNGGHLTSAVISATFEGVMEVSGGTVDRFFDEEVGLNLMDL